MVGNLENTASTIRLIFARNLRHLGSRYSTTSEFSRQLGIERNKLSRYLDGSSSPPPEVLNIICEHFGVDANILLTPIDKAANEKPRLELDRFLNKQFVGRNLEIDDGRLPNGLYQHWQYSVAREDEGLVVADIVRIYRTGDAKLWRSIDPHVVYGFADSFKTRKSREVSGLLFGQSGGFGAIHFNSGSTHVGLSQFKYGYKANQYIFPGSFLVPLSVDNGYRKNWPEFLEYLGDNSGRILSAARQKGYCKLEEAPVHVSQILGRICAPSQRG